MENPWRLLPVPGVFPSSAARLGDGAAAEVPALDVQAVVARARTGAGAAAVAVRLQGGQVHVGGLRRGRGELHLSRRRRAFPVCFRQTNHIIERQMN